MKKVWIIIAIIIGLVIVIYVMLWQSDAAENESMPPPPMEEGAMAVDESVSEGSGILAARGSREIEEITNDSIELFENNFIRTEDNNQVQIYPSTKTDSWSNLQASLTGNILPPADQIEINELVNFFNYSFPESDSVSFVVELIACPWNREHQLLVLGVEVSDVNSEGIDEPQWQLEFKVDVVSQYRIVGQENFISEVAGITSGEYLAPGESVITIIELASLGNQIGKISFNGFAGNQDYRIDLAPKTVLNERDKAVLLSATELGLVLRNSAHRGEAMLENITDRLKIIAEPDPKVLQLIKTIEQIKRMEA